MTNDLSVTPVYAAILAIVYLYLSFRVIALRRKNTDSGDPDFRTRIRVHGNFAEYTPFALLLTLLAELQGAHTVLLHGLGLMLLIGRISHAVGMGSRPQRIPLRITGMVLTFTALLTGAIVTLSLALF